MFYIFLSKKKKYLFSTARHHNPGRHEMKVFESEMHPTGGSGWGIPSQQHEEWGSTNAFVLVNGP